MTKRSASNTSPKDRKPAKRAKGRYISYPEEPWKSSAEKMGPAKKTDLLDLPYELRRQIFSYLLCRDEPIIPYDEPYPVREARVKAAAAKARRHNQFRTSDIKLRSRTVKQSQKAVPVPTATINVPSLLLVNHQISEEALDVLYRMNTFTWDLFIDAEKRTLHLAGHHTEWQESYGFLHFSPQNQARVRRLILRCRPHRNPQHFVFGIQEIVPFEQWSVILENVTRIKLVFGRASFYKGGQFYAWELLDPKANEETRKALTYLDDHLNSNATIEYAFRNPKYMIEKVEFEDIKAKFGPIVENAFVNHKIKRVDDMLEEME